MTILLQGKRCVITVAIICLTLMLLPACSRDESLSSTSIGSQWKVEATFIKRYDLQGSTKTLILAREFHLIPFNTGISEVSWQASSFWYGNYGGSHRPVGSQPIIDEGERVFEEDSYTTPVLPKISLEDELDSLIVVIQWKDGTGTHSETHHFKGLKKYR